jgi:ADP-ribose pyrophosphatase YjhB (NUDIX family)
MTEDSPPETAGPDAEPTTAALYQWALLFNDGGDVLLLQPAGSDEWTLPGGPLAGEERAPECLVDRVGAATGLATRTVMPVEASRFEREGATGFGVVYLCEILGDRATDPSDDYDNVGWLPAEGVDEATLPRANQHRALQAAIAWREWLADPS